MRRAASRAYEAAYQLYRSHWRGRDAKPPPLNGLDLETFNAVREVCEKLLASGAKPINKIPKSSMSPITLEKLVEYLRQLTNSVERHTKLGGRHGYLEFVRGFIP